MVGNFYFHFPFSLSFCLFQFNSGPVLISPTWKLRTTPHLLRSTMAAKFKHKNKNKKTVNKHHRFLFHNPPPIVGATGANTDDDLDVKVFPPSSLLFRPRYVSIEGNHRNLPRNPPLTNTTNHRKPLLCHNHDNMSHSFSQIWKPHSLSRFFFFKRHLSQIYKKIK